MFKRKDIIDADGSQSVKYKARFVCRGFQKVHGVYNHETYAPVYYAADATGISRPFRSRVAPDGRFHGIRERRSGRGHFDLELHQMDVSTAFVNGDLDEDIHME